MTDVTRYRRPIPRRGGARDLRLAWLLLPLIAIGAAQTARAASYQIVAAPSTLLLRVWKEGALSMFAHDHVVRATRLSGTVRFDPARPAEAAVEVQAPAASLVIDEASYRHRVGLPPMDDSTRGEVQKTMAGEKQMDVARFATLSFRSTQVKSQGDGRLLVSGDLSLHGQTHSVSFPATVEMRGTLLHASASLRFRQSTFGITPYSSFAVRNKDEVELQIDLIAQ